MKFLKIIILIISTATFLSAQAQKKVDQQTLTWIRYYAVFPLNVKWAIHSEIDNRNFVDPIRENLWVLRIQGRYRANKTIEMGAGITYFNVNTQDPHTDLDFSIPEYRAQQDATFNTDFAKITFHNRFQLEERFIQKANKMELLDDFSFSFRMRYRLQSIFTLFEKENQNLKGIISDEIMFNFGKTNKRNTFDQNRIYTAFRYQLNPNIGLELGYLKNFQRRASGVDFYDRDIIRFTIHHKINRKIVKK
ncbi:DUF2490 domain-containing protein [Flavobacterium sp. Fl-77]|uniref:DUF2490 domain-containing protein n=1 Tax=Flavobacterium flavipigmentatum TaxID=2893884 RepID=A0AAJ2SAM5_9FLAO|nr:MULTISPECIES: DUF2490 domain-containing protein [unclassified Flavobacterium]MDX6183130.1 DUF2490 domain-containing protein [Flavobacterium sp. Fl-33]MDX6186801.1 DUF2490 domain-containing protein [Flavobacterium sp. Fl-77]UFH40455.1 DUF2490 domain-containing protein [Flavobacterium sp. F-70]